MAGLQAVHITEQHRHCGIGPARLFVRNRLRAMYREGIHLADDVHDHARLCVDCLQANHVASQSGGELLITLANQSGQSSSTGTAGQQPTHTSVRRCPPHDPKALMPQRQVHHAPSAPRAVPNWALLRRWLKGQPPLGA